MPRPRVPGQCIHCFKTFQTLTWDHVFPRSWYPDSTPENLEKWKVPACRECNKELGEIEESLLFRFALCLDPHSPAAKGILQKVLRSANAFLAKNEQDKRQRQARREKLLRALVTFESIPSPGVLPGFGGRPGIQGYTAVRIPDDELRALVMKIVKGLAYKLEGQILDGAFEMRFYPYEGTGYSEINDILKNSGRTYHWGLGLTLSRVVTENDPACSLSKIEFWQRFRIYIVVRRLIETANA